LCSKTNKVKNLHLLPTDKPSRWYLHSNGEIQIRTELSRTDGYLGNNQHIYITSSEKIKEGDWYYLPRTNSVSKCIVPIELNLERRLGTAKIILTTDQDLINDGVQDIDDEFLEWFVKNPSCEEVKIEDYGTLYNFRYLILIPQEEPKQDPTLEEVAAKHFNQEIFVESVTIQYALQEAFITGAKWQQERMYSEEDMRKAFRGFTSGKSFKEWFEQFKSFV